MDEGIRILVFKFHETACTDLYQGVAPGTPGINEGSCSPNQSFTISRMNQRARFAVLSGGCA